MKRERIVVRFGHAYKGGNRHHSKSIEGIAWTLSSPDGGVGAHHRTRIGQPCVVHNVPICRNSFRCNSLSNRCMNVTGLISYTDNLEDITSEMSWTIRIIWTIVGAWARRNES